MNAFFFKIFFMEMIAVYKVSDFRGKFINFQFKFLSTIQSKVYGTFLGLYLKVWHKHFNKIKNK